MIIDEIRVVRIVVRLTRYSQEIRGSSFFRWFIVFSTVNSATVYRFRFSRSLTVSVCHETFEGQIYTDDRGNRVSFAVYDNLELRRVWKVRKAEGIAMRQRRVMLHLHRQRQQKGQDVRRAR